MVFCAPPSTQQEPHTAEIVREHLDGHLTAQAFKLVLGDHSHPEKKRFQYLNEDVAIDEHAPSTASLVSMKQISLKPGGRLIALALTAKKQCLPVGFESRPNPN